MAGHSKFKNIMHRKGAQDKKRSSLFSKLSREITVAAKMGLPDPAMNARLRAAVLTARAGGMPKDNIERAIKKAEGSEGENYEELRYEGFGPGGVSLIIETLTDNRNRTATNVRTAMAKNGGNLGASGSVSHGFERMGLISYPASAGDAEAVFEAALEAGAEDVQSSEDGHEIWTAADALHEVAKALEAALGEAEGAKLAWKPGTMVSVGADDAGQLFKLIDVLEDDDDVQTVWGNYDVPDEVLEGTVKGWLVASALMMAVPAAADDEADIRAVRAAYNAAILARDVAAIRPVFGPGYKGIAGSGGELIDGGDAMAAYFANVFRNPAFVTFTRTPEVIRVGEGRERAMERGRWLGRSLTPGGDELQLSGEYLAVWVPMDARWVLRSESFVTLARREVPVSPLP